jgi:hypothetical protein
MQRLGVLGAAETPSSEDMEICLNCLNAFIDSLGVLRLSMYFILRSVTTLVSGTATYTIGGASSVVRPLTIDHASLILDISASPKHEIPIAIFDDAEWQAIAQKTLTSTIVQGIYYDRNWVAGAALIYVWPIPTVSTTQLVLYTPTAIVEVDQTTAITMPPAYERMLEYNGAVEMADYFKAPVSARLDQIARQSLKDIKAANVRVPVLAMPASLPGVHGRHDIRTG